MLLYNIILVHLQRWKFFGAQKGEKKSPKKINSVNLLITIHDQALYFSILFLLGLPKET